MFLAFLRHGGVAALLAGVVVEALAFLSGRIEPLPWPPARKLQHRLHYDHHVEPNRLDLLFLPVWFLVPNLAVATSLVALLFGAEPSLSALFGMMLAILHYEWVHYVAHIPYQPRTQFGRWLKQYHLRHHFISEKHWFGVSSPTLDGLFGTFHGPDAAEKSSTVRKLY
jgi:4-hydroxysphinganine ceramide fatty acyl 2-hydroxylase